MCALLSLLPSPYLHASTLTVFHRIQCIKQGRVIDRKLHPDPWLHSHGGRSQVRVLVFQLAIQSQAPFVFIIGQQRLYREYL